MFSVQTMRARILQQLMHYFSVEYRIAQNIPKSILVLSAPKFKRECANSRESTRCCDTLCKTFASLDWLYDVYSLRKPVTYIKQLLHSAVGSF